jgi:hypothetical protein
MTSDKAMNSTAAGQGYAVPAVAAKPLIRGSG